MFNYCSTNKLISKIQSSFQQGDACINHLLAITTEILEVLEVFFLDISKAFDNVWHKRLIFKLKQSGIELLYILSGF